MADNDSILSQIDHIVVLMLENHSLDSLLGYLYVDGSPSHFVPPTKKACFDGVASKHLSNLPDPSQPAGPDNEPVPVGAAPWQEPVDMTYPSPDPGETFLHVNCQLYGSETPPNTDYPAPMNGFVADYIDAMKTTEGWDDVEDPTRDQYSRIMNSFTPQAVPVLNGLAKDFAVCDEWFCAVPSQTFCNRSFFNSGQSNNNVVNEPYPKWLENTAPTLMNLLTENNRTWRVYWDKQDIIGSLTRLIHPALYPPEFDDNFREYGHRYGESPNPENDRFSIDCGEGDLPDYTFIEPRLFLNHNDMHPPTYLNPFIDSSILAGEILVNKIYEDLFVNGAKPDQTLLIITFDEHGGCYDHVPPPKGKPPSQKSRNEKFTFNRLGVRVPTIFVSPWIQPRTVVRSRSKASLEHTSIIRTLCEKWCLQPNHLTDRDLAAPDLGHILNAPAPRTQLPRYTPRPYTPVPEPDLNHSILSDLQRDIIGLLEAKLRTHIPINKPVVEILHFIEDILKRL